MLTVFFVAGTALAASGKPHVVQGALTEAPRGGWVAGQAGARITVGESITVDMAPRSIARVLSSRTRLWLDPHSRHVIHTLVLQSGRIDVHVNSSAANPKEAMLVRGARTVFGVVKAGRATLVGAERTWTVASSEGDVLLYKERRWRQLPAWSLQRFVDGAGPEGEPEALPAKPQIVETGRLRTAIGKDRVVETVTWAPVPRARAYDVEVRTGDQVVERREVNTPSASFELGPGHYSVTVCAIGEQRLVGRVSDPVPTTVLGLNLPEGGYVGPRGDLRLPRNARVTVVAADAVQVSYGAGTPWVQAPSALGLLRNQKTVVRFRTSDGGEAHTVVLAPRALRAKVTIGPRSAVWPLDDVSVTVRILDEGGGAVPAGFTPDIRVLVGVREVQVEWQQIVGGYRAVVPKPHTGRGPWVVRVDVRDAQGNALGYDFLEVAAPRASLHQARLGSDVRSAAAGWN